MWTKHWCYKVPLRKILWSIHTVGATERTINRKSNFKDDGEILSKTEESPEPHGDMHSREQKLYTNESYTSSPQHPCKLHLAEV